MAPAASCLGGQTPPSPQKPAREAAAFFPAHSTSLSSLKRKKCFLNKTNTAPNQTQGQTRAEPSKGRPHSDGVRVSCPFPRGRRRGWQVTKTCHRGHSRQGGKSRLAREVVMASWAGPPLCPTPAPRSWRSRKWRGARSSIPAPAPVNNPHIQERVAPTSTLGCQESQVPVSFRPEFA